jgi:hypothetical protein
MGEKSNHFCALVTARQGEKNLDYSTALREISRENPLLAEEYAAETTGRRVHLENIGAHKVMNITGAQKELHDLTCARMSEKKIGYGDALVEIGREHPDLCEIARLEIVNDHISKHIGTRG